MQRYSEGGFFREGTCLENERKEQPALRHATTGAKIDGKEKEVAGWWNG